MPRVIQIFIVVVCLPSIEIAGYAQHEIVKRNIPANLPEEVKELIEAIYSPYAKDRGRAARTLGYMGEKAASAVPFLKDLLSDNSEIVLIMHGLISTPGEEAAKALVRIKKSSKDLLATLKDEDWKVRKNGITALRQLFVLKKMELFNNAVLNAKD